MEIRVTLVMPRRFRAHVNNESRNFSDFILRFYRIRSGLPEFVAAFFFIPHVFVRFYYVSQFAFLSPARFTFSHIYYNAQYITLIIHAVLIPCQLFRKIQIYQEQAE